MRILLISICVASLIKSDDSLPLSRLLTLSPKDSWQGRMINSASPFLNDPFTIVDPVTDSAESFIDYDGFNLGVHAVMYVGLPKDTIQLPYFPMDDFDASPSSQDDPADKLPDVREPDSSNLKIFIDTTREVSFYQQMHGNDYCYESVLVKAYFLYVHNVSNYNRYILGLRTFQTDKQAKTNIGGWVDLEVLHQFGCGRGPLIHLRPGEILIAKVLRNGGKVKTECRLKYGDIYSNTYYDYIDEIPGRCVHANGYHHKK